MPGQLLLGEQHLQGVPNGDGLLQRWRDGGDAAALAKLVEAAQLDTA